MGVDAGGSGEAGDMLEQAYQEAYKRLEASWRPDEIDGLHIAVLEWLRAPPAVGDYVHGAKWLTKVATRRRIDEFRKYGKRIESNDLSGFVAKSRPEPAFDLDALRLRITAFQRLHLEHWLAGLNCRQTADRLGCVFQAVSQARQRIRKAAAGVNDEE